MSGDPTEQRHKVEELVETIGRIRRGACVSFNYPEKLVAMANQISRAFAYQGPERAPASIAEHLRLFWNPSMRTRLKNYIAEGRPGLDPLALEAIGLPGDVSVQTERRFRGMREAGDLAIRRFPGT